MLGGKTLKINNDFLKKFKISLKVMQENSSLTNLRYLSLELLRTCLPKSLIPAETYSKELEAVEVPWQC